MGNLRKVGAICTIYSVIILALSFIVAVSQEPFTVTAVEPADGATDVSVYRRVRVDFSTDLKMDSITDNSFFITDPSGDKLPIVARVVSMRYATLYVGVRTPGTTYTIHVTTDVQNFVGTPVASEYTSTFTTGGVRPIAIDIKPGDNTNIINLRQMKTIPVTILSSTDFDAPDEVEIDRVTLTFGVTGDEQSLLSCETRKPKDVNGDGLIDLECQFSTNQTNFPCGRTVGVLRGETLTGGSFEGRQAVLVTQCK